jgi:hypothetical protein
MKSVKLLVALMGISLAPLASASEIQVWNAEYETYVAVPVSKADASRDRLGFSGAEDASDWIRSEWRWNDEYDTYVAAPILSEDPFQERLVYSNHYADEVPFGMALRAALEAQQEQSKADDLVWSDRYADYVPRNMTSEKIAVDAETARFLAKVMKPCPEVAAKPATVLLAAID